MKRLMLGLTAVATLTCSDGGSGPGPTPTRLSFTAQPANAVVDTAIPVEIKVSVLDQSGAVLASATPSVTLALGENPGSATLDGTTSVTAVGGVATFSGITLNAVGDNYTLVATATGLTPDTSSPFDVTLSMADGDGDTYSPHEGDCNDFAAGINPGATDHPDGLFVDQDCDGIDGERDNATFVSQSTGADGSTCGTEASPCATIQQGIDRAVALGRRDVYVVAGTYAVGAFTMADGVSVYGHYGLTYNRSPANVATVTGNRDFPIDGGTQSLVVLAENITLPTVLADLTLSGADAIARLATGEGKSTYVIVARDIAAGALTITRNTIIGRTAAAGRLGANGANATTLSGLGLNGGAGGAGDEFSTACDNTSRGAGGVAGPVSGTGGTLSTAAGAGGRGGTMDTDCNPFSLDLTARPGEGGFNAGQMLLGFGGGGVGGTGVEACGDPEPGESGRVNNGDGGVGASGGFLIGDFWHAKSGGDGRLGDNGGGGGGGGGAGGCDLGTDSYGAGGGGGGAGGRLALGGGERGSGGGGSFGIFLINATVNVSSNTIMRGNGGNGAAGGIGGQGQSGGQGGPGGLPGGGDDAVGGRGGNGGHGGHGGGGGGGAGGVSYGIYLTQGSSATQIGNTFSGGSAGTGGAGGASAPGSPAAERDGNAGQSGAAGTVSDVGTCASPAGC